MSNYGTIRRYSYIIRKVRDRSHPSLAQIKDYLFDKGIEKNVRTIQRDFEDIRDSFGINISYCRKKKGYYISETELVTFAPLMRFLEHLSASDIILESITHSREILSRISFDEVYCKGIEYFSAIIKALDERRVLSFNYTTSLNNEEKECEVFPYLLKEYRGRWYLVASYNNGEKLYVFGLNRISNLKVTKRVFVYAPHINPVEKFKDIIGLTVERTKKEKVLLSYSPEQAGRVKSLPLHSSQRVISEDKDECRIQLDVIPNLELKQRILMHGSKIKVLSPKWLADEIKDELLAGFNKYK